MVIEVMLIFFFFGKRQYCKENILLTGVTLLEAEIWEGKVYPLCL